MKKNISRLLLICFDVMAIYMSIVSAYAIRRLFDASLGVEVSTDVGYYSSKIIVYIIVIMVFANIQIYKHRHDFWEETWLILKALWVSIVIVLSVLALGKSMEEYSRFIVVLSFVFMAIYMPIIKYILKNKLLLFGLWRKKANVVSTNSEVADEIFKNRYLGYTMSTQNEAEVVFFDTKGMMADEVDKKLSQLILEKKEVIFIPLLNSFNFASAKIIELFNSRTNMIVLESALLKKRNVIIKKIADLVLSIMLLPLLIPIFIVIILLIKKEKSGKSVFFTQERMGKDGKTFLCYKFRSMHENGDNILNEYLKENPEEVVHYNTYHKYIHDPRITKVGNFLRKTSLDELPQIFNVFKGEMSLIGPRPYMLNEREKIAGKLESILAVKPGITGLWQVSGRNDVDFQSRVDMDVYYTRNWNLWLDFVIAVKTIKTVLVRNGAR